MKECGTAGSLKLAAFGAFMLKCVASLSANSHDFVSLFLLITHLC